MKLRLYIDGQYYAEEKCATQTDVYEIIAYWHIKYQLARKMKYEIFLLLPSKMNKHHD